MTPNSVFSKKLASQIVLGFIFLGQAISFQNCGQGFDTIKSTGFNVGAQSSGNPVTPVCSLTQSQSCELNSGYGVQFCSAGGSALTCTIESCKPGYTLQNGTCDPISCSPNTTTACTDTNGSGIKTCNTQGTAFGSCILNTCDSGYTLQNGVCVVATCTPRAISMCSQNNGAGTHACNDQGTGFGTCNLSSCNPGFNLQNGVCTPNACNVGAQITCSENNGIGVKTCNSTGTGFGACVFSACVSGNNLQGGVCIANSCTPNTQQMRCSMDNGNGFQLCNAQGTGYGACVLNSCTTGFNLQGGLCVANTCNPGSKLSCSFPNGTGSISCNASGTGYDACQVTACDSDSNLQNGLCVLKTYKTMAVGANHMCAINSSDSVECEGFNNSGQLGVTSGQYDYFFNKKRTNVSNLTGATAISVGNYHSCAVTSNGEVKCWGDNSHGQLGNGTNVNSADPVKVLNLSGVKAIASSTYSTCVTTALDTVKCWGGNPFVTADSNVPVDVINLSSIKSLISGDSEICGITTAGSLTCWGTTDIVNGSRNSPPTTVSGLPPITSACASSQSSCAITNQGGVKCWGFNIEGALGNNSTVDSFTPVDVINITGALAVSCTDAHNACALTDQNKVKCWGRNAYGTLGNNTLIDSLVPVDVIEFNLPPTKAIGSGGSYNCALSTTGLIQCWGNGQW